jgi:hypothetical protein
MPNSITVPLFLAFIFLAVPWLLARTGGWAALANRFRGVPTQNDSWRSLRSLRLAFRKGSAFYNYFARIQPGREGIALRIAFPLAFGHARLLIPWHEVEYVRARDAIVEFKVKTPAVTLWLAGKGAGAFLTAARGAGRYGSAA